MSNEEERTLIVEALYKSEDLAESNEAFNPAIMAELKQRIPGLTEANFEDQLYQHLKALGKVRNELEQGGPIENAFVIAATGTGILLELQKTMHSAKIAKQSGLSVNLREKLEMLNSIRINRVGGREDDQISRAIQEILQ